MSELENMPEVNLWVAVLNIATLDCMIPRKSYLEARDLDFVMQSRKWFGSKDFNKICSAIDLNPDFTLRKCRQAVANDDADLDTLVVEFPRMPLSCSPEKLKTFERILHRFKDNVSYLRQNGLSITEKESRFA